MDCRLSDQPTQVPKSVDRVSVLFVGTASLWRQERKEDGENKQVIKREWYINGPGSTGVCEEGVRKWEGGGTGRGRYVVVL